MDTKQKATIALIAIVAAFAFGRFSAPEKIKIETKIVEVERKTSESETDRHKESTTTEVTRPDGTKEKTTTTTEDTNRKSASTDDTNKNTEITKEVTKSGSPVTIQALAAVNVTSLAAPIDYGMSISRPLLGPITVGIFGFSSGKVGFGIGLTF